jgi:CRISPR/Cas system CSM-associated protein Csm3 (group 7 of RAMP superfamily)
MNELSIKPVDNMVDDDRRNLTAWWRIQANLSLQSASQIGAHPADTADQTFTSDETGRLVLYGSTLAGALRSALLERLSGFRKVTGSDVCKKLFGDSVECQSLAIVFDTKSLQPAIKSVRDGVRIKQEDGIAADGAKFDREVAWADAAFPIRIDLQMLSGANEQEILSLLCIALSALADGSISLGVRRTRGLGAVKANSFVAKRYDLTTKEGWIEYAKSDYALPAKPGASAFKTPAEAIAAAWNEYCPPLQDLVVSDDLTVSLELKNKGSFLIRSPGQTPQSTDVSHLTENNRQMLSGTSLAGAFRSRAVRIVNTLAPDIGASKVDNLFGTTEQSSRVRTADAYLGGSVVSVQQTRIKIDRFTGGTIAGALFDETVSANGSICTEIKVKAPEDYEIGLLILVARDLIEGLMTLGGGAAIGRGVFEGSAKFYISKTDSTHVLSGNKNNTDEDLRSLQVYVDALLQELEVSR